MYIPDKFSVTDVTKIQALIRSDPLGSWVTNTVTGLEVNHVPFALGSNQRKQMVLRGHINKANTLWKELQAGQNTLVVFQGAHAYVSPSWYPSKAIHGKVVPTWNYMVAHAHGHVEVIHDSKWLLEQLNSLTTAQEHKASAPWAVGDAPDEYIEAMLNGIVGIEITISKLEGMWKLSQNKSDNERRGVIQGLVEVGDDVSLEIAAAIQIDTKANLDPKR